MNSNSEYITIPEAAEIYKSMLNCKSKNKYDNIYRSILQKAKAGMFSPTSLNSRALLINRTEFCKYIRGLSATQYEQLQFNLDSEYLSNTQDSTTNLKELLTLIKLHRQLEIPPEETLRYIEKLVSLNLNQRGD